MCAFRVGFKSQDDLWFSQTEVIRQAFSTDWAALFLGEFWRTQRLRWASPNSAEAQSWFGDKSGNLESWPIRWLGEKSQEVDIEFVGKFGDDFFKIHVKICLQLLRSVIIWCKFCIILLCCVIFDICHFPCLRLCLQCAQLVQAACKECLDNCHNFLDSPTFNDACVWNMNQWLPGTNM